MTITDNHIQADYIHRINRVFEFIDENLESDLSLNVVSEIAYFSPFHFHRIFKFITGDTLNKYVSRRRIETSASDILHKNITVTALAHKYGFSDNASYSKAFKKHFGVSPTAFKTQNPNRHHKIRQLKSKNGQAYPDYEKYICVLNTLKDWIHMNAKIEVKEMQKIDLAYLSCIGAQNLEKTYETLLQWATIKGLMNDQTKMVTIYYDSFKITAPHNVRMRASIVLNKAVELDGALSRTSIPEGKCIVGHFEIGPHEFEKSWTGLYLWMNENGYTKADNPPFEMYHNNFNEHPEKIAIVDFFIPIV